MSTNLTPARRCKVVNQDDREYQPVPYPDRNGSVMLELCKVGIGYIFKSKHEALSAIHHTIEYRKKNGEVFDKKWRDDYIVFEVGR